MFVRKATGSVQTIGSRVTGLSQDIRLPGYLTIEIDGNRFTSLPQEHVLTLDLRVGETLTDDKRHRLLRFAQVEAAHRVGLRLLAARPRSTQQILRALRDRGHDPEIAQEVVDRLESAGLLNDQDFARHFARVRVARGHGRTRLVNDLVAKGLERRVAEGTVTETLDAEGVEERELVRQVAAKRVNQLGVELSVEVKRRRLAAYLSRRGFSGYHVHEVLNEML